MEWFDCTEPEQLVVMAAIISIGISKNMTLDQINTFGNFLQMLSQNMLTIAAQRAICESKDTNEISDNEVEDEILERE